MSETTGTPGNPADTGAVSPPANDAPAITISDAARLLSRQRRSAPAQGGDGASGVEAAGGAVVDPAGRKPSPNEAAAAKAAPAAPPAPVATPPADTGLSAMEKALGVPAETSATPAAPAFDNATPLPAPIVIEGRQLRTIGDIQKFAQDK